MYNPFYNYQPNYQTGYQSQQYQPQQIQQPVQQLVNPDERIWVQGEEAAKAYLVAPNGFVRLWDSTKAVFYEKRTDQTGKPVMDIFEYSQKNAAPALQAVSPDYEGIIKDLQGRIEKLEREVRENESIRNNSEV